jgi:tetratricopeptide (TPR) repeat protein
MMLDIFAAKAVIGANACQSVAESATARPKPEADMETSAKICTFPSVTLILLLLGSPAMAQKQNPGSYLKNVELCNGSDRTALDARIKGCTALIDKGDSTTALAMAHNNRGTAYVAKADYDRAIQDFDQSIKLNPSNARPFSNRGVAYLKKGELDLAIAAFDEAIKLNPNYSEAFANRAEAYLKQHNYDRAARDYDDAIRIAPGLDVVWSGRCWARAILGNLQAALEDCNKALQARTNAATYDSRGLIYLKMGQFGAAIDDYNSALQFDPKLATALYGRGLAKLKQGNSITGETDIAKAKAIQPNIGDEFARYGAY